MPALALPEATTSDPYRPSRRPVWLPICVGWGDKTSGNSDERVARGAEGGRALFANYIMTTSVSDLATTMLKLMFQVEDWLAADDPRAQLWLDAGAVRVVDGQPQFHLERFTALAIKETPPCSI